MAIKINGNDLQKRFIGSTEIVRVYKAGCQVRPDVASPNYLCFTALAQNANVKLSGNTPSTPYLEISTDGNTWTDYVIDTASSHVITLSNIGDKVMFRNKSTTTTPLHAQCVFYGDYINVTGDVNYLINKNSTTTLVQNTSFGHLFSNIGNHSIINVNLPATTLVNWCYLDMFSNFKGTLIAPILPATTLATGCYASMFRNSGITTAPVLQATTLAEQCYSGMFRECTSLITPPNLPATALTYQCYYLMFSGCTSLTYTPSLSHVTSIERDSCSGMFSECTSLATLPLLSVEGLTWSCFSYMFDECTSIKISETQTGEYQTPYMIPSTGNGYGESRFPLEGMFDNTGGTFTGTPLINTTYYTSNTIIS